MKNGRSSRWTLVAVAGAVVCVIALSATSQVQQRVQPVTQLTVGTPVVASTLAQWQTEYAEAMKLVAQLKSSGQSPALDEQIENDLNAMDEALTEYVRVSERLRHKDRALTGSLLSLQNSMQRESRLYQTLSNALRAAHDVEMATIRNMK